MQSAAYFRFAFAENGQAALEMIGRNRYDLVLTDLRMPGMDGAELYRRLVAERRAQIERLLQEARDKGWKDPGGR